MCPLHSKTRSQMSHGCLCSIVRCLRLRHIDNGARHRANHNHTTLRLALHQMPSDLASKEVGPVNVHAPEFPQPIWWVCDSVKVLGETGRRNQMVDLAVVLDDFGDRGFDRLVVRDITEMRRDLGDTIIALVRMPKGSEDVLFGSRVLLLKVPHQFIGLTLSLVLCRPLAIFLSRPYLAYCSNQQWQHQHQK